MTAVLTLEEAGVLATPYDRDPRADSDSPYAWRYYKGNKAFASAFRKGAVAAIEGKGLAACPYEDLRTDRGGVTFSRAFARAWGEGWHHATFGDPNACALYPVHDGECVLR